MVTVIKKKGENNETLFRKFTRIIIDEKLQDDFRERMFYVKPSQVRKEKEKNRNPKRRKQN
jgi:ribosomal protein S21